MAKSVIPDLAALGASAVLLFFGATIVSAAQPSMAQQGDAPEDRIEQAHAASARLIGEIRSVDGCLGAHSARTHDGVELIMAWFEDRAAVLRWFEHPYHRKLLRDAGRPEDHVAAEYFGDDVRPILVIASVAYDDPPGAVGASMFDDPAAGRPTRFAVEYYTPLPGGAYMIEPFAPWPAAEQVPQLRDVFAD